MSTGRAAKRLAESTGRSAQTIHSAIRYTGEKHMPDFLSTEDSPFQGASIIIVDEASMLDQMIASWFVQLVPEGARVVFAGDADQLPSVGAGDVLHEMICSGVIPVTRLQVIFRQKGENLIVTNAMKIHQGDTALSYDAGFQSTDTPVDTEQVAQAVDTYVRCYQEQGAENVMLLCSYKNPKNTIVNTGELNRLIQEKMNPIQEEQLVMKRGHVAFHAGDRVMQLKNKEDVLNGDVGIVDSIHRVVDEEDSSSYHLVMTVEFSEGIFRDYSRDMLDELDLAYASTVHKSQGSEYPTVILVLSNKHRALLQRNLVYTAITRATQNVTLIGDITGQKSALATAIRNVDAASRYSLLSMRLQALCSNSAALKKVS